MTAAIIAIAFSLFVPWLAHPGPIPVLQAALKAEPTPTPAPYDWRQDWGIEPGFAITPDSSGYELPTAIAFVPQPGPNPDDPLYFVAELYGSIKVVTNDRSVHTFATEVMDPNLPAKVPDQRGESGLTGLCLDPEHGYVFATAAMQDASGALHNNVVRYTTTPGIFGLTPTDHVVLEGPINDVEITGSHQIDGCLVDRNLLYVGVGDGYHAERSPTLDSMQGKVVRMTLDGKPAPDNPFRQDDSVDLAANYIWARGFRNPFGMTMVDDRLFVAENGNAVDRLLEVQAGENYLWNGDDWSIGTHAIDVFAPQIAPTQLAYYPPGAGLFPADYDSSFFIGSSVLLTAKGLPAGVVVAPYDWDKRSARAAPKYFIKYRGIEYQRVVGLALGPDGLYFAPLVPDAGGKTYVFKVSYDPAHPHPYGLEAGGTTLQMMAAKGCLGCHRWQGYGGGVGPDLTAAVLLPRLRDRLASAAYRQQVAALDASLDAPYLSNRQARQEVLAAQGDEQLRLWVGYHLLEPKFDNAQATMPNLFLSQDEAWRLAAGLLHPPVDAPDAASSPMSTPAPSLTPRQQVYEAIDFFIPELHYRHIVIVFVAGAALGALVMWAGHRLRRRRQPAEPR